MTVIAMGADPGRLGAVSILLENFTLRVHCLQRVLEKLGPCALCDDFCCSNSRSSAKLEEEALFVCLSMDEQMEELEERILSNMRNRSGRDGCADSGEKPGSGEENPT